MPKIIVVGQVCVDVLFTGRGKQVRLGGIFHACRALAALGAEFGIAFIAPSYLNSAIISQAGDLGATASINIGVVDGCPNVILVGDPSECSHQGYEYLLEKSHSVRLDARAVELIFEDGNLKDTLIIPGGFDLELMLNFASRCETRVHVDINFDTSPDSTYQHLGRELDTLFVSTSSHYFVNRFGGDFSAMCKCSNIPSKALVLKENRGGVRCYLSGSDEIISAPTFLRDTLHSVGVGDCFDAAFIHFSEERASMQALRFASLIAADYACSENTEIFHQSVSRCLLLSNEDVIAMQGVCLPWESRPNLNVYIAAPDFAAVDQSEIDAVESSLAYHNFSPHRPVKENGEIDANTSLDDRCKAAAADMSLLDRCQIIVAVTLYDDPGTYIEIGYALSQMKPVILYSPNRRPSNLLAQELPTIVTTEISEVVNEVFIAAQRVLFP